MKIIATVLEDFIHYHNGVRKFEALLVYLTKSTELLVQYFYARTTLLQLFNIYPRVFDSDTLYYIFRFYTQNIFKIVLKK